MSKHSGSHKLILCLPENGLFNVIENVPAIFNVILNFGVMCLTELRKTTSALAEHPGISQEHIDPINIISPPDDINWDKCTPNHVIT